VPGVRGRVSGNGDYLHRRSVAKGSLMELETRECAGNIHCLTAQRNCGDSSSANENGGLRDDRGPAGTGQLKTGA
jgi:hypothetical protein